MISPDTISLVRDRTDIVAVVSESVPSLKRRGRAFVGLCPFHSEKTPSFHVNPDRGFFHCFGCKESGSVVDFLIKHDGYSFPEAVRALAERLGIPVEETDLPQDRDAADRARKQIESLYAVNQLAASFFETQLHEHPERQAALDELARRGLENAHDTIQAFRIGYAPAGWDALATFLRSQTMSPIAAETVGLLVPRTSGAGHYDRFRQRLMFPVVDPQGRVVGFSGRVLPGADEAPKYINSPESPVYSKGAMLFGLHQARQGIRREGSAVLVEGNFDVVSLHARGLDHVVAPLGTAFTVDQAKLLKRFAPQVTLLFDGDAAGQKATSLARAPCKQAGLSARVAVIAEGRDPDEVARTDGIDAIRDRLTRARGMLEYLIDTALDESFVAADAHERAARVERVARLLTEEEDPLVRMMGKSYADRLAGRLDLVRSTDAFRALEQIVRKAVAQAPPQRVFFPPGQSDQDPQRARVKSRRPGAEESRAMVGALIEFPSLLDDPEVQERLGMLEGPAALTVGALARARKSFVSRGGTLEIASVGLDIVDFLAQVPGPIHAFASERLAAPLHDSLEVARASVLENASKLQKIVLGRETEDLARAQQKVVGDWQAERELAENAQARVRQKHGIAPPKNENYAIGAPPMDPTAPEVQGNGHDGDEEPRA